jgi:hypothetical protein
MTRPHTRCQRRQALVWRRRRFELGEDRPERVETWGERESLVIRLPAQISGERGGGLFVGQFNLNPAVG